MPRPIVVDLNYDVNNGVIAVAPTYFGRLKKLVKRTTAGHERVWVFKDTNHVWIDKDGDERIDHRERGVVCGNCQDVGNFLKMCSDLGLIVQNIGLFVPFSNGAKRFGRWSDGAPDNDYSEAELKLMRWDLPTRDDLLAFLKDQVPASVNDEG